MESLEFLRDGVVNGPRRKVSASSGSPWFVFADACYEADRTGGDRLRRAWSSSCMLGTRSRLLPKSCIDISSEIVAASAANPADAPYTGRTSTRNSPERQRCCQAFELREDARDIKHISLCRAKSFSCRRPEGSENAPVEKDAEPLCVCARIPDFAVIRFL